VLVIVIVVVAVVVVIVGIALAYAFLFASVTTAHSTVTGASWTPQYQGNRTGYFDGSPLNACAACPIQVAALGQFTFQLLLMNNDTFAHNVTQISASGFFTVLFTSPSTPFTVSAHGSTTVTMTIEAPPFTGQSYVLSGTITTT
jgi:hypothetical protein